MANKKEALDKALINSMSKDAQNYKGRPVSSLVDRDINGNKIRGKSKPKPQMSGQRKKDF